MQARFKTIFITIKCPTSLAFDLQLRAFKLLERSPYYSTHTVGFSR
jgi:hypothetical protein